MKKTLLTMAAAVALVGCSNEDLLNVDNNQVQDGNAIAFSTYVGDNAQSRASVIYYEDLQPNGFGVNAYYTGQEEFNAETEYSGNAIFMDNTKVTYNNEKKDWVYSPVKYWPNNTFVNGSGDTQYEMVSFFAYAPYNSYQVKFDGTNRSTLKFTVENDVLDQVDLIYHPAAGNDVCAPTINLGKPSVDSRVSFNFQHALSRITFDVKAVVDETDEKGDNLLDGNTRINIKSVQLVSATAGEEDAAAPFYKTGTLNLINGEWTASEEYQEFTFNGSHFYRAVNEAGTDAETDDVVQLTKFNPGQPLLDEDSYLMIIPKDFSTTDGYRIYIEYDVISEEVDNNGSNANETNDSNTITNKIYSEPMNTTFGQGKAYKFTLLLGMTSVKFEADVDDWEDAEDYDDEVWLPENDGDASTLMLNTYAEDLNINETVTIEQVSTMSTRSEAAVLSFSNFDEKVISYDGETNQFTALAAGSTSITVSCEGYKSQDVIINVLPNVTTVKLTNKIKVVNIEGGTFAMGCTYQHGYGYYNSFDDAPRIEGVEVESFQMGQYEVSVEQFIQFVNANTELFSVSEDVLMLNNANGGQTPICTLSINGITGTAVGSLSVTEDEDANKMPIRCSWEGAALFAKSVGGFLPTEAQWEYAAKAGEEEQRVWWYKKFPFYENGEHLYSAETGEYESIEGMIAEIKKYENLPFQKTTHTDEETDQISEKYTSLRAIETTENGNDWGLYDLLGNVPEWCGNYYYNYNGGAPDQVNHPTRGTVPNMDYICDQRYDQESEHIVFGEFLGVAFRNQNTDMDETGFRVAFASDYNGDNSEVKSPEE